MVAGAVAPPRLDLTNKDLLRAHIHAVWLAEAHLNLGKSLTEILELTGDAPSLALKPEIREKVEDNKICDRARARAAKILRDILPAEEAESFLDLTMQNVSQSFDRACDRWRDLYKAALKQIETQEKIRRDPSRSPSHHSRAERSRREALSQRDLLIDVGRAAQSDFYSYRYFATEGFLPGYSFPRLPLSAFVPGRRLRQPDGYLSRPRFLAISEFGPRAIIYHEGSKYSISKVTMPVSEEDDGLATTQIKQCEHCGYIHPHTSDFDLCQRCKQKLDNPLRPLLRMQNVSTKRRDRINADEEERQRWGYELRTGLRFNESDGEPEMQTAAVQLDGEASRSLDLCADSDDMADQPGLAAP